MSSYAEFGNFPHLWGHTLFAGQQEFQSLSVGSCSSLIFLFSLQSSEMGAGA